MLAFKIWLFTKTRTPTAGASVFFFYVSLEVGEIGIYKAYLLWHKAIKIKFTTVKKKRKKISENSLLTTVYQ